MQPIAQLVQHNPSLVLVLLVGLPSLTWAAAYARRPSRARRRVAIVPFALMWLVALAAVAEAIRAGSPWWPALACAGAITAAWLLAFAIAHRHHT